MTTLAVSVAAALFVALVYASEGFAFAAKVFMCVLGVCLVGYAIGL